MPFRWPVGSLCGPTHGSAHAGSVHKWCSAQFGIKWPIAAPLPKAVRARIMACRLLHFNFLMPIQPGRPGLQLKLVLRSEFSLA